jgi:hypothetical protein
MDGSRNASWIPSYSYSMEADALKDLIRSAFADVKYPGNWCLRDSDEGEEPALLEAEFSGKNDWTALDAAFLDQAPGGYGSALSFFSDEAFRFYLPAYLLADLEGSLEQANVVYYLTNSLARDRRAERINPKRYGERTWLDHARYKFSVFSHEQVRAIIPYLERKERGADTEEELARIEQALNAYWRPRLDELGKALGK